MPAKPSHLPTDDDLLKPREAAEIFGVRTITVARWAREGKLMPLRTPGGHRRYRLRKIRRLVNMGTGQDELNPETASDAVRLYDQGWNIRQVAAKCDCSYGVMRRILHEHTKPRDRGVPGR